MWIWLNDALHEFKRCFSNKRAFSWFVIIIVGIMVRGDHMGLTSIVRELSLTPSAYTAILHFFRAESWCICQVRWTWLHFLVKRQPLYRVGGKPVMVGDGVKQAKEGRYMPGVKKLHQESENSSKGEYIFGHMFGGIGLLAGNLPNKLYCILISLRLHDGLSAIHGWNHEGNYEEESHVVKIIKDAIEAARQLGSSLLLLDRLYLTVPMLKALSASPLLQVVTKAKSNATAFYEPKPKTGRGAKPKKGDKVSVSSLFQTKASEFVTTLITMYEKEEKVSYYCVDLLWGNTLYQKLRFVLTVIGDSKAILVSTDLTLAPEQIISLYGRRFKIECSFRELKQVVGGFSYRFWSKVMPKLNKYMKNTDSQDKLKNEADENRRAHIKATVEAIDGHAMFGCIALGLLQLLSIQFADTFKGSAVRFMRTASKATPSEATVAHFMRKNIFQLFRFFPHLAITRIISQRQLETADSLGLSA
jgi:hypothetical protein